MFWLKKALSYCLMPLQFSLILMLFGLVLVLFTRRVRAGKWLLVLGFLTLVVLSHKQVGMALLLPLETRYAAIPDFPAGSPLPPELAACRTIVVLGGGHSDTPGLSATNRLSGSAASRLMEAVRIARLLPEARIVFSGPGAPDRETHAATLAAGARSLGIDPARFVLIEDARDTPKEAAAVKALVGSGPFALVTSAWHMPRSVALMRGQGLAPVPCPADFASRPNPDFRWNDWTCDLTGLDRSTKAIYERLGLLWARLHGKT